MSYAQWKNISELKEELVKVNEKTNLKKSGIPLASDEENLYIDDKEHHTLVIGSTGSGKTQTVVLPQLKLAMLAEESMFVTDYSGELYKIMKGQLDNKGYKTYVINLHNKDKGNNWNPLKLPYDLYKDGKKDEAIDLLNNIGKNIFSKDNENVDPFWENSAIQYFLGVSLYLFENAEENEINLNSIYNFTVEGEEKENIFDDLMKSLNKNTSMYANLSVTLNSPQETRGSILAVFKQGLNVFTAREGLSNILANNDFNMLDVFDSKVAIFFVGKQDFFASRLIPIIFYQLYSSIELNGKREKRFNIILDDFTTIFRIENFSNILNSCRTINVKITIVVTSILDLERQYGKDGAEVIKYTIGKIIYLLANDLYTLEEISKLCGNHHDNTPLITVEELKILRIFEAIVLMPRNYPIRTKLTPDYQIAWPFEIIEQDMLNREKRIYNVFSFK